MNHVVLLGDSIFDNAAYVPGKPAVIDQLRTWLPREWQATLLALDGAVAEDVPRQLARLPADATHLIVSVGGNDALGNSSLIADRRLSAMDGFMKLTDIQEQFRQDYREMLHAVLGVGKPTVLCTIYDSIPDLPRSAITGLSVFNDLILREGFRRGLPILDLRLICTESRDYSSLSPIEPSEVGGAKIVRGIGRVLLGHDFSQSQSVVWANDPVGHPPGQP
jgi:hypothetical protein